MRGRRSLSSLLAVALAAALAALAAAPAGAGTREPLRTAFDATPQRALAFGSSAPARQGRLRAIARSARRQPATGPEPAISSSHFGAAAIASVAATLRSLAHGPELAELETYVATAGELRSACGGTALACYLPAERRMVVSGVDRRFAGVPRDFAIAHEYGHHIAAADPVGAGAAVAAGTLRWATYERVCQLSRRGRLFPGNQGAHYWEDPEEAFAQAYAHLNRPAARISWQYSTLLRPTPGSLAKIQADVARPRQGPVASTWTATAAGSLVRRIRTPLDGPVAVSLRAQPGTGLVALLREPGRGRVVAHAATAPDGSAELSHRNCGAAALELEVRARSAPVRFQATIARP